jgi:hypothetical protein
MSEAIFQAKVIQLAKMNGWRVFHPMKMQARDGSWRTALSGDKGWPDLALAHRDRGFIIAELKTDKGRLTEEQQQWLYHLAPWAECHLWRPEDLNKIAARLSTRPIQN